MDLLPFNSVHVDLVDTDDPAAWEQHEAYRALMSPDEHERMARLVFDRDRRSFLLTRALVRTTLSRYAAVPPAAWAFIANVHGRPEILDRPAGVPDLRFNLSHTDGLIACAITIGREVGVDVEHIRRRLTHDVAGRFFAPREIEDLKALTEDEQQRLFFDYWTLKEAYSQSAWLRAGLAARRLRLHPGATGAAANRVRARIAGRSRHLAVRTGLAHPAPSSRRRRPSRRPGPAGADSQGCSAGRAEVSMAKRAEARRAKAGR